MKIVERRLQARVHNTFKELGRPLAVNLISEEGKLTAGADIAIEDYRVSTNVAIIFEVLYTFSLESTQKQFHHTCQVSEYLHIPQTNKQDVADAYFEQSVDMRNPERQAVFTENGLGVCVTSPSLDPTTSSSALRLKCFVSTSKMIMQRVKQGILKGILEVKARESQLRQTSDVQALIDLET